MVGTLPEIPASLLDIINVKPPAVVAGALVAVVTSSAPNLLGGVVSGGQVEKDRSPHQESHKIFSRPLGPD